MCATNDNPGCSPSITKRVPTIRVAVERLQKASEEVEALVSSIMSVFEVVMYHQPTADEAIHEPGKVSGSDLGRALTMLAERFEQSNRALRGIVDQADL